MPLFIIVYNPWGLGFGALAIAAAVISGAVLPAAAPRWIPGIVGALVALIADGSYRLKYKDSEGIGCLVYPSCGGHLWFIPIWVMGLLAFGAAFTSDHPARQVEPPAPVARPLGRTTNTLPSPAPVR